MPKQQVLVKKSNELCEATRARPSPAQKRVHAARAKTSGIVEDWLERFDFRSAAWDTGRSQRNSRREMVSEQENET